MKAPSGYLTTFCHTSLNRINKQIDMSVNVRISCTLHFHFLLAPERTTITRLVSDLLYLWLHNIIY